jgi:hypothetical protein
MRTILPSGSESHPGDGWGARARILMCHFDIGSEAEFSAMAPDGVTNPLDTGTARCDDAGALRRVTGDLIRQNCYGQVWQDWSLSRLLIPHVVRGVCHGCAENDRLPYHMPNLIEPLHMKACLRGC